MTLLGLLIDRPMSLEEIKNVFVSLKLMDESGSEDVVRIDINTLKKMGCKITRADRKTNNKFVLKDHPFKIYITKEELNVLKRVFNKVKENADISLLVLYDNLFKKIMPHIADEEAKEILAGISPLKQYSSLVIDRLKTACKQKSVVKFVYKAPTFSEEAEKEIYADKLILQNNKLYLYGVDKNSGNSVYFNIKRIVKILSCTTADDYRTADPIVVRFLLKDFGISGLADNEEIESGDAENGFVICGRYHNSFFAIQRILSFGSACTVIEPNDIRNRVVEILQRMRDVYNV